MAKRAALRGLTTPKRRTSSWSVTPKVSDVGSPWTELFQHLGRIAGDGGTDGLLDGPAAQSHSSSVNWDIAPCEAELHAPPDKGHESVRTIRVPRRWAATLDTAPRSASTPPDDPDAALRGWLRVWAKKSSQEDPAALARRRAAVRNADAANLVWAVDFQLDATTDGRPIKLVSIIDEYTRECLTSPVDRSVTADVLIDGLDRLAMLRGYPTVLRCDNGPELACEAMAEWAGERVGLSFTPPGEPWRNGYVESFNGRVRDQCLNINTSGHWPTPAS